VSNFTVCRLNNNDKQFTVTAWARHNL